MSTTRTRIPGWLAPLSVAAIWGLNVPVMKVGLAGVSPFVFNALRLTLSVVALGVAERIERRGAELPPTPWRKVLPFALLTSLVYQVLFIEGIAHTSASHTGFLIASGPLWTALLAQVAGIERPGRRAWIGLGLAFVGTTLVAAVTSGTREATLGGNLLVLLAMLAWAWGTVSSRSILERYPATRLAFLAALLALPGHWILAWSQLDPLWDGRVDAVTWAAIAYSGVFSTGVAYALWNRSVRRLGPSRTSAYTNLVPICALSVAWVFLDERPSTLQLTGGALILVGLGAWRSTRVERPDDATSEGAGAAPARGVAK